MLANVARALRRTSARWGEENTKAGRASHFSSNPHPTQHACKKRSSRTDPMGDVPHRRDWPFVVGNLDDLVSGYEARGCPLVHSMMEEEEQQQPWPCSQTERMRIPRTSSDGGRRRRQRADVAVEMLAC